MTLAQEALKGMKACGWPLHFLPGERVDNVALVARVFWIVFHVRGVRYGQTARPS